MFAQLKETQIVSLQLTQTELNTLKRRSPEEMRPKDRLVRIDLNVYPAIDAAYREVILSQGENASSDYRRYQKEVVDNYQKNKHVVESIPDVHISPRVINKTLDKWLIDAKRRFEDGTIEDLKGITKKSQHYTNTVNSYQMTHQRKIDEEKKNKALLESTTTDKRIRELEEENRRLKEEREKEQGTKHEYESRESKGRQQYPTNYIYTCK